MEEEEINRVIANYMGYTNIKQEEGLTFAGLTCGVIGVHVFDYSRSLDALIPVVEKLHSKDNMEYLLWIEDSIWYAEYNASYKNFAKTPALALATACAKVIKELE